MKRFLLASAALVALTGVAYSQEAPYLSGNYGASVDGNQSADSNRGRGAYDPGPRVYYRERDYDRPRYVYRDYDRPRYRDYDRPRYVYRDYDYYDGPRYHRHAFGPRAGFSVGIRGPGWGVGFSDYDYGWR